MYAVLGEIEFDLITYFDGLETQFGSDYAEHALIGRKPRLQFVGEKLDEVRIDLVFHVSYCDPEAELVRLKTALTNHDALALVLGNGDYKGRFVMTELSSVSRHTDRAGNLLAVEARMTLREFTGDPAEPRPPAVRPAGSTKPLPARVSPVANGLTAKAGGTAGVPAVAQVGGLAKAVSSAKSVLSTASGAVSAVLSLKSLASADPLTALSRLPGVVANVDRVLPGLGASAETMQSFSQVAAVAADSGRIARGLSTVRMELSGVGGLAAGATSGSIFSQLSSIEALASRASTEIGNVQQPLARLAARAATRMA